MSNEGLVRLRPSCSSIQMTCSPPPWIADGVKSNTPEHLGCLLNMLTHGARPVPDVKSVMLEQNVPDTFLTRHLVSKDIGIDIGVCL